MPVLRVTWANQLCGEMREAERLRISGSTPQFCAAARDLKTYKLLSEPPGYLLGVILRVIRTANALLHLKMSTMITFAAQN